MAAGFVDRHVAGVGFEIDCTYRLKCSGRLIYMKACHFVDVTKSYVSACIVRRYGERGGSTGSRDVFLMGKFAGFGVEVVDGDFIVALEGYVYALHGFRLVGLVRVITDG